MGRPSWADDEQTAWLWGRHDAFLTAHRDADSDTDMVSGFMTKTQQQFFDKFPLCAEPLEPSPDGKMPTMEERIAKREQQIYWWFWNRRFKKKGDKKAAHASRSLGLAPKRPRPQQPYQAYMHLYKEKIMPQISDRYVEYKAELPEGEEPKKWWPFCMEQVKKLLEDESDEVKAEVETKRKAAKTSIDWDLIFNTDDNDDVLPISHAQAVYVQSIIDNFPNMAQNFLTNVERQSSWKGCVLMGGPLPETGQFTILCVHQGRTLNLGNSFPKASESWSMIEEGFSKFIASCFPPDAAQRLSDAFKAIPETSGPEQDTLEDSTAPPSASDGGATTVTSAALTITPALVSPAAQPTAAQPKQTGKGKRRSKGAKAKTVASDATGTGGSSQSSTAATPASPAPTPSSTDVMDPQNTAAGASSQRTELHPSNNPVDSPLSLQPSTPSPTLELSNAGLREHGLPEWMGDTLKYFALVEGGEGWMQLVAGWQKLEAALGHPDGQNRQNWLLAKGRPEEIKIWTKNARDYEKLPKIKSVEQYTTTWKQWWTALQPRSRMSDSDVWPMPRVEPTDTPSWELLRRGGCNGFFLVVISLAWWVSAVLLSGEGLEEAMVAVEDVSWVCSAITTGSGALVQAPTSKRVADSSAVETSVPAKRQRIDTPEEAPVAA
ncbi:hypothetical protein TRAPUB_11176 [Trametes pubescens]|uniref:Uncharacterized protein n=1 Tax=Trametes pubescens TaxID=154538 RepID=A0A1M2VXE2_TRAPU|nr:hypothetical protein TRAPUB_11176 [Trametes pubescens]